MKSKKYILTAALLAVGIYLMIPGCGNKDNNNNAAVPIAPPGQVCIPGQICNTFPGQLGGTPLLSGPVISALSSNPASQIILTIATTQPIVAGQFYQGPVNVSGEVRLAPNECYGLYQGGVFPVQGQGQWVNVYGTVDFQASLQMGGTGGIAQIGAGSSVINTSGNQYYLRGNVQLSICPGRVFVANYH